MSTCLFLSFRSDTGPAAAERAKVDRLLRAVPTLHKALVHTPSTTSDLYVKDAPSPSLVLQLYFASLPDLEASVSHSGSLRALTSRDEFSSLAEAEATQQAMLVRPFAVPDPEPRAAPGEPYCTYLVSYEGEAEDLNAWHTHYLENHTRHMAMFPGIRELEVYTRLDWVSALAWPRQLHAAQQGRVRQPGRAPGRAQFACAP